VLSGACDITPGFAQALERVFGTPAIFWTNLQANYDREKLVLLSSSPRPEDMNIRRYSFQHPAGAVLQPSLFRGLYGAYWYTLGIK